MARARQILPAPTRITCAGKSSSTWAARKKARKNWKQPSAWTMNVAPSARSNWKGRSYPRPNSCRSRSDTLVAPRPTAQSHHFGRRSHMKRFLKIFGIVIGILIVIAIALPFFIDANMFRPKLESELTDALGRQVKVGNLSLSLLSGGVAADNISIADDPKFSNTPFVQAKSLKVGVELLPLIFSRTLNVTNLTLDQPQISLVKSSDGTKWNFSSLGQKNTSSSGTNAPSGSASSPKTSAETSKPSPQKAAPSENAPATPVGNENSSSSTTNLSVAKL